MLAWFLVFRFQFKEKTKNVLCLFSFQTKTENRSMVKHGNERFKYLLRASLSVKVSCMTRVKNSVQPENPAMVSRAQPCSRALLSAGQTRGGGKDGILRKCKS